MTECTEHHFGSSGRCNVCSMQARYYYEAISALNRWSKKEKEDPSEHWQEKMDSYKCKPHTHDPHHGTITEVEHLAIHGDPFHKLYDMEAGQ